jgi:prohibitin 2
MIKRVGSLALIGGLTITLGGCAVIGPGERGIKQSFGKVDNVILQPGLTSYNPFAETITHMSIQQQTFRSEDENNRLTDNPMTSDQQPIKMSYSVMVRYPEGQLVGLYKGYQGDPFDSLIAPKVNQAVREVVSQYKADQVTQKAGEINAKIVDRARQKVGDIAYISDIPITHFELPKEIQAAIKQKQVMEQTALQKEYELDAARKQAEITIAGAEAQARSIQLQSQALMKSPQLIEYEKAKRWDGKLPTTVISGGPTASLFRIN